MKNTLAVTALLAAVCLLPACTAKPRINTDADRVAMQGYDPVSYFPEAGGKPTLGSPDLAAEHQAAVYHFVNQAHREAFLANPQRFAPAYGGWCAYAMADGSKVRVDPLRFEVHNDRLYLFYREGSTDTLVPWQNQRDTLRPAADVHWKKLDAPASP
jgi:hypothetical protein